MKIFIRKVPKSKIELTIEVEKDEWGEFIREASRELAQDLKMPGFRKGKVPPEIAKQKIDEKKLHEKATETAIKKSYVRAILEKEIEAIGPPTVNVVRLVPNQELSFKATVAVLPEIKIADYKKIARAIKKNPQKVEAKETEETLAWLQKSRSKFITVPREAREGDRVEIDFETSGIKAPESLHSSKKFPVILGETKLIPGFEKNLLGMKEGEEKTFSLVFPKDPKLPELAEKLVDFKVKMNLVQARELPKLDDEFARSLGNFQNFEALKKNVSHGLLIEKENKEKERWRIEVVEKIAQQSKMELPEVLVENEIDRMESELKEIAQQFGLSFEQYLVQIKKSLAELRKIWSEKAAQRARVALVLKEIAKKENVEVEESELEEQVNRSLKHYQDVEQADKKVDIERLKEYSRGVLRNEKVFELLEIEN